MKTGGANTVKNEEPETAKKNAEEIAFEKYKYRVELLKWFIGSVVLVLITTIINAGFKDREAGIQEIQQYDKYVTNLIVLNKEVGPRRLLAQYFANVTASDKLRTGWQNYYQEVNKEYKLYLAQDSVVKQQIKIIEKKDYKTLSPDQKRELQSLRQKNDALEKQLNAEVKVTTVSIQPPHATKDTLNLLQHAQQGLILLKYYQGPVDGQLSPELRSAVMNFQKDNGLVADGIPGFMTTAKIIQASGLVKK